MDSYFLITFNTDQGLKYTLRIPNAKESIIQPIVNEGLSLILGSGAIDTDGMGEITTADKIELYKVNVTSYDVK